MYNKVIMMGRLTRDPELKTTPSGVNVCSFSIAVDRRFQAKGEEKKTDFFNIVAWRTTGEFVVKYFRKGSLILVEGELQTRQYTNKDGINVNVTEIIAEQVSFTGEKARDGAQSGNNAAPAAAQTAGGTNDCAGVSDDDYPF